MDSLEREQAKSFDAVRRAQERGGVTDCTEDGALPICKCCAVWAPAYDAAHTDRMRATDERDDARGNLASLADRLNIYLRENGLVEVWHPFELADMRAGLDRLAHRLAHWRAAASEMDHPQA